MPYVEEEGGRLNNYAIEPKMYMAEPPTAQQKKNYVILGGLGAGLIASLVAIAYYASNAG
ncbi:MAG: ssl1498 family light-harvesting-like protein [Cyanobacteria bacterium SID2]|nr:ssl1498 family light-harvesting-like protein [Cyanobacteria bacterium SID2]MBP0006514.1 ssl1498 family light-harvesting-like protein [Cyanobacteria bacterium SBC]